VVKNFHWSLYFRQFVDEIAGQSLEKTTVIVGGIRVVKGSQLLMVMTVRCIAISIDEIGDLLLVDKCL
jgi:hypothetical protein